MKENEGLRTCSQQSKEGMHIQDEAARLLYLLLYVKHSSAMDIDDSAFLGFSWLFFLCSCFVCAVTYGNRVMQYIYSMSVLMAEVSGEKY